MNLSQEVRLELLGLSTQLACIHNHLAEMLALLDDYGVRLDEIQTSLKRLLGERADG